VIIVSGATRIINRADVAVFTFFNIKIHSKKLSQIMKLVTELGSSGFSVLLILALIIQQQRAIKLVGFIMAASLLLSQFAVQLLKRIVNRVRPYKAIEKVNSLKPTKCVYSFPSGHTSTAFCIALTMSYFLPILNLIFISVASLVGISRIYLGCHYPTDVLIGGTISLISFSIIVEFVLPVLERILV
jgi:undecaprenyl-diphosphatase